jgi:hypothetical protein
MILDSGLNCRQARKHVSFGRNGERLHNADRPDIRLSRYL